MPQTFLDKSAVEGTPIDAGELARLRQVLLEERAAQAVLAVEHEVAVKELTGQRDVDSVVERELAEVSLGRAREAVADIDAALARIDRGTYGLCERCGVPIAIERLEAIPHTRSCVACPGRRRSLVF